MTGLSVRNLTRRKTPVFPFTRAAKAMLPDWEISLAFVTDDEALRLNKTLRRKSYIPNVLSYETGKRSGEIVICLAEAVRQAPEYEMTYPVFCGFLFIHAVLHLEGYRHGPTMDTKERERLARFVPHYFDETPNRNGNRHRNLTGEDSRRRSRLH
ncbi:MAG: rRNA maturation RNase YbeY [Candidatus Pacebacteria bacterium]|nr:rRNA maturation RNase YbeY [Candidatus Paceibacterota bacterium]MBP9840394.1 rRNA maturation RNase YbeY [Candidatus Paceibacterota bacterium]